MKPVFNIVLSITTIVGLLSCTESVKFTYNESKSLPIKAELNGSKIQKLGTITPDNLKQLLNIPSDANVTKFAITGFTIQVNPTTGTDADYIEYFIYFSDKDDIHFGTLANSKRHFVATGDAFNISSELDAQKLDLLKCLLGNLILTNKNDNCRNLQGNTEVNYGLSFEGKDFNGNPKTFNGSITGTFHFQVSYSVCEEVPEGLFKEFEKCK